MSSINISIKNLLIEKNAAKHKYNWVISSPLAVLGERGYVPFQKMIHQESIFKSKTQGIISKGLHDPKNYYQPVNKMEHWFPTNWKTRVCWTRSSKLTIQNCIGATGLTFLSSSLNKSRVATVKRWEDWSKSVLLPDCGYLSSKRMRKFSVDTGLSLSS